jgi:hypothetical protein
MVPDQVIRRCMRMTDADASTGMELSDFLKQHSFSREEYDKTGLDWSVLREICRL